MDAGRFSGLEPLCSGLRSGDWPPRPISDGLRWTSRRSAAATLRQRARPLRDLVLGLKVELKITAPSSFMLPNCERSACAQYTWPDMACKHEVLVPTRNAPS